MFISVLFLSLKAGDIVGEMGFLTGEAGSASVVTQAETEVFESILNCSSNLDGFNLRLGLKNNQPLDLPMADCFYKL